MGLDGILLLLNEISLERNELRQRLEQMARAAQQTAHDIEAMKEAHTVALAAKDEEIQRLKDERERLATVAAIP